MAPWIVLGCLTRRGPHVRLCQSHDAEGVLDAPSDPRLSMLILPCLVLGEAKMWRNIDYLAAIRPASDA